MKQVSKRMKATFGEKMAKELMRLYGNASTDQLSKFVNFKHMQFTNELAEKIAAYLRKNENGFKDAHNAEIATPHEVLHNVGYNLFEVKTQSEMDEFKKYYAKGEALCKFGTNRLDFYRMWFIVKKDIDKINREDFENPERQDLYGTSCCSIEINNRGFVRICNRYNHAVAGCDNTFNSNLNNIAPGLVESFTKYYGVSIGKSSEYDFHPNVLFVDEKFIYMPEEKNGVHFCRRGQNYINHDGFHQLDPSCEVMQLNYVFSTKKGAKVFNFLGYTDSAIDMFNQCEKVIIVDMPDDDFDALADIPGTLIVNRRY